MSDSGTNSVRPTLLQSVIPILVLIGMIALNVVVLDIETLEGPNQISLLFSALVAGVIALINKVRWETILEKILKNINMAMSGILVLLMIGCLAGTWMLSGIIPSMIHYGLMILRPGYFLPATVVICALISVLTGSSWSTIATVGVALLGIGNTLGFNEAMVAGAIISGAYFGDKISPMSDTTNLAAATVGIDIFRHIHYMMKTTVPTILITIAIFAGISLFKHPASSEVSAQFINQAITSHFNTSPLVFIVPVVVILMVVKKWPAVVILFIGSILGALAALVFQPDLVRSLAGDASAAKIYGVLIQSLCTDMTIPTGNEITDSLFTTGGMSGMLYTVWLSLSAMIFSGAMEAGGFLEHIAQKLIGKATTTGGLVSTTAGTCILFNGTTSDQYMSIMIPGNMYAESFRKNKLAPEVLSRTLEDTATVTSVLIPWNTCGATQARVLGIATITYLPFCFFCYLSPIMTMLFAWFNIKIRRME
ncbi:MAG: sodium:proton antiporter [Bacteroidales bacterium]|nr:sodium:proton antiporter [Bacteroidales bacterium]